MKMNKSQAHKNACTKSAISNANIIIKQILATNHFKVLYKNNLIKNRWFEDLRHFIK